MSIEAHPAANLFPVLGKDGLRALADEIQAHGLMHPIVLYEGLVLDGRNRLAACELIGREAETIQWDGKGASPTEWVIATNLHRRNLTPSQHAAVAVEALPMLEAEAKERQRLGLKRGTESPSRSIESDGEDSRANRSNVKAAKQFGVGHATVSRAKHIKKEAPELFEKVKAGDMTVNAAMRKLGGEPSRSQGLPAPAPLDITKKHNRTIAEAHLRRLEGSIATIRGTCDGLKALNYPAIAQVSTTEHRARLAQELQKHGSCLRLIRETLEREAPETP